MDKQSQSHRPTGFEPIVKPHPDHSLDFPRLASGLASPDRSTSDKAESNLANASSNV